MNYTLLKCSRVLLSQITRAGQSAPPGRQRVLHLGLSVCLGGRTDCTKPNFTHRTRMWDTGTKFPWDVSLVNELQFTVSSINDYTFQLSWANTMFQFKNWDLSFWARFLWNLLGTELSFDKLYWWTTAIQLQHCSPSDGLESLISTLLAVKVSRHSHVRLKTPGNLSF